MKGKRHKEKEKKCKNSETRRKERGCMRERQRKCNKERQREKLIRERDREEAGRRSMRCKNNENRGKERGKEEQRQRESVIKKGYKRN